MRVRRSILRMKLMHSVVNIMNIIPVKKRADTIRIIGEIPAMVFADALCRMVPGVLTNNECFTEESHFNGLLEYPQYTKPAEWRGVEVPEVLLSGHHANIEKWRREKSLEVTQKKRPDLLNQTD